MTFEELKVIIANNLYTDEEKVTMDARFREDLHADSIDMLQLIVELEEKTGISVEDDELTKITTVGDAFKLIENKKI